MIYIRNITIGIPLTCKNCLFCYSSSENKRSEGTGFGLKQNRSTNFAHWDIKADGNGTKNWYWWWSLSRDRWYSKIFLIIDQFGLFSSPFIRVRVNFQYEKLDQNKAKNSFSEWKTCKILESTSQNSILKNYHSSCYLNE